MDDLTTPTGIREAMMRTACMVREPSDWTTSGGASRLSCRLALQEFAMRLPWGGQAWTDYPITELGDVPGKEAPVREVRVLAYDGNKMVTIEVEGVRTEVKSGYVYLVPGRCQEVPALGVKELASLPKAAPEPSGAPTVAPAPRPVWTYVSVKGKEGTVEAHDPQEAWKAAGKRHKLSVLHSATGEAYVASRAGGCLREPNADWDAYDVEVALNRVRVRGEA